MKIQPLKSYTPPAYPTFEESKQDARLLDRLPRRWRKGNPIVPLLGTGILIQFAGSGCGRQDDPDHDVKITVIEPLDHKPILAMPETVRTNTVTRVAPMLEDALANDGRGAFGCVAVSAPVFFSENEAMDLIENELAKTGLKFHDIVTVDGLLIPTVLNRWDHTDRTPKKKNGEIDWEELHRFKIKNLAEGTYAFDFGTEDKSVVVKFLQMKDFDAWKDEDHRFLSSVQSYDFASLAIQVRNAFAQRDTGDPVIIGLFFEPSVHPEENARWEDQEQTRNETKARAKEKLRAQVAHFVAYLKQEGVVE